MRQMYFWYHEISYYFNEHLDEKKNVVDKKLHKEKLNGDENIFDDELYIIMQKVN